LSARRCALATAAALLPGLGVALLLLPVLVHRLIHGNPERRLWLIRGPAPFDGFGSSSVEMAMDVGFAATGLGMIGAGLVARSGIARGSPAGRGWYAALGGCCVLAATGIWIVDAAWS
jgi:hypothetical protein